MIENTLQILEGKFNVEQMKLSLPNIIPICGGKVEKKFNNNNNKIFKLPLGN